MLRNISVNREEKYTKERIRIITGMFTGGRGRGNRIYGYGTMGGADYG